MNESWVKILSRDYERERDLVLWMIMELTEDVKSNVT